MWKDPIVEEVRSIRDRHAKAFGYDIKKIIEDAKAKQSTSGHPLVSFATDRHLRRSRKKAANS